MWRTIVSIFLLSLSHPHNNYAHVVGETPLQALARVAARKAMHEDDPLSSQDQWSADSIYLLMVNKPMVAWFHNILVWY
ncbi:hypothetical protein BDZ91DRAFT_556775 [Kalaharituber pfeilii]|nr:hypothetical protein BDZ91DRAFT_556775 [Kalaharituber pfeilii]